MTKFSKKKLFRFQNHQLWISKSPICLSLAQIHPKQLQLVNSFELIERGALPNVVFPRDLKKKNHHMIDNEDSWGEFLEFWHVNEDVRV